MPTNAWMAPRRPLLSAPPAMVRHCRAAREARVSHEGAGSDSAPHTPPPWRGPTWRRRAGTRPAAWRRRWRPWRRRRRPRRPRAPRRTGALRRLTGWGWSPGLCRWVAPCRRTQTPAAQCAPAARDTGAMEGCSAGSRLGGTAPASAGRRGAFSPLSPSDAPRGRQDHMYYLPSRHPTHLEVDESGPRLRDVPLGVRLEAHSAERRHDVPLRLEDLGTAAVGECMWGELRLVAVGTASTHKGVAQKSHGEVRLHQERPKVCGACVCGKAHGSPRAASPPRGHPPTWATRMLLTDVTVVPKIAA